MYMAFCTCWPGHVLCIPRRERYCKKNHLWFISLIKMSKISQVDVTWVDRLRSTLTRTDGASRVHEDHIWSSVFFLLACSLLPSLTAPISLFLAHLILDCTNWNPRNTRRRLLGWATLCQCSTAASVPISPAAYSHILAVSPCRCLTWYMVLFLLLI